MAFIELNIFSNTMQMQQPVYVVMPQITNPQSKPKCLYLLHGLSDNHATWMRNTSIERYAQKYNLCVVMPFGNKSFYTDMKHGEKYFTYVAIELPKIIENMFNVSDKREDRFIAGNSMGGYGALKIAMRECDRFSAAIGLSSAVDVASRNLISHANCDLILENVFGHPLSIPDNEDLFKLAEKCSKSDNMPQIYMAVGTEDYLYGDNQRFKEKLSSLGVDYTYEEGEGGHSWAFWDKYISRALDWLLKGK